MNYNKACIILGVTESDTLEVIRKKYLKLIAKYHPDINQSSDATKKAQEINQAYDYLKEHYETERTKNSRNNGNATYSSVKYYKSTYGTRAQSYSYQRQQYYQQQYSNTNYSSQFYKAYNEFCAKYQNNETVKEYMRVFNESLKDIYMIYTHIRTEKEFINHLKNEIEENKYCKILNKTREMLYNKYLFEHANIRMSFLDYLKERVEELQYLKKIDRTRENLYSDYTLYERNSKTFLEYLKEQVELKKYCDLLNRTLVSLRYDFKYNQKEYKSFIEYLDYLVIIDKKCKILNKSQGELNLEYVARYENEQKYTFSEYLDIRIEEEKYCKILNDSRSNLNHEYRISGNYNITFLEFLKQKVASKNKVNKENTDKKIMDNINKILNTNSIRSVSNQELRDVLMVVFKNKLKELFEILQNSNNMEDLIILYLSIYKATHSSECIRYANILGRDIDELVNEYISTKQSLNFKEYLIFKILNEKRDQNFEEEMKSKIRRK